MQRDLAKLFFSLDAAGDFLVAGGAALLASDLVARPTEDLDLFAAASSIGDGNDHRTGAPTERRRPPVA